MNPTRIALIPAYEPEEGLAELAKLTTQPPNHPTT